MQLSPVQQKFILHWGEMGTQWGINRGVAQVHALLFIAPSPLNADDITELLHLARSSVSLALKELQGWGIVRRVHVLGDRRDHFESLKDVWEMFRTIADERKRREVDPTLAVLRECLSELEKDKAGDRHMEARLRELSGFFQATTSWYEQLRALPTSALVKLATMSDRVLKLVGLG